MATRFVPPSQRLGNTATSTSRSTSGMNRLGTLPRLMNWSAAMPLSWIQLATLAAKVAPSRRGRVIGERLIVGASCASHGELHAATSTASRCFFANRANAATTRSCPLRYSSLPPENTTKRSFMARFAIGLNRSELTPCRISFERTTPNSRSFSRFHVDPATTRSNSFRPRISVSGSGLCSKNVRPTCFTFGPCGRRATCSLPRLTSMVSPSATGGEVFQRACSSSKTRCENGSSGSENSMPARGIGRNSFCRCASSTRLYPYRPQPKRSETANEKWYFFKNRAPNAGCPKDTSNACPPRRPRA